MAVVQIVEDDPLVGMELFDTLTELGYEARKAARSVADALVAFEREQPDVALIDIGLAGDGDGVELATMLRRRGTTTGIIFLTSHSHRKMVDRAVAIRPDAYLIKPVNRDTLYAAIETVLQRDVDTDGSTESRVPAARLKRVIEYMEENLSRNLTLDDLAAIAGLSSAHFSRNFRGVFNESPHRFLVGRRIARACRLLLETEHSLNEVAAQVGYESQSYFTTLFRRETGETPASFRRRRHE